MKEITQRKIFDYLLKNKIYNFVGVPDSTMKYFIDQGLKQNKILIATREEEAIGIAAGMSLHFEKTGKMISKSLNQEQKKYDLKLSGGDTTNFNKVSFSITCIGFSKKIVKEIKLD